jgi:hypothetical protein
MINCYPVTYPKVILHRLELEPCSRLYSLEPIGVGTPYVESLTGYFARLAESHLVSPAMLLSEELAPVTNKEYLLRGGARIGTRGSALGNSFQPHARAINGFGVISRDWISGLRVLTKRHDIHYLTLSFWEPVLSRRNLFHPSRAWCPHCYEEWRNSGLTIYEPLIWALDVVKFCPRHNRPLRFECPHCNRKLSFLGRLSRPGHCSKCGSWLGAKVNYALSAKERIEDSELAWTSWLINEVGTLLAAPPLIDAPPSEERIANAVSICINSAAEGNMAALSLRIGKGKNTVWGWRSGTCLMPLEDILRLCYSVGVSVLDFIVADFSVLKANIKPPFRVLPPRKATKRRNIEFNKDETRQALEMFLLDSVPLSMVETAKRLNQHKRFLYKHFPDLCRAIAARHAAVITDGGLW